MPTDPLALALQREVPTGEKLARTWRPQGPLPGTGIREIGFMAVIVAFVGMLLAPSWGYLALPFLAYGVDLAWRHAVARNTIYGLTEQQAIRLSTFPRKHVTVVELDGPPADPAALFPPPVRKRSAGDLVAMLILLWIAVLMLSFEHGPGLMSGGG